LQYRTDFSVPGSGIWKFRVDEGHAKLCMQGLQGGRQLCSYFVVAPAANM